MSLNRREMLRLGAAGAGGILLSSAASAAPGASLFSLSDPLAPMAPPRAITPQMVAGVNPALLARAKTALDSHSWGIRHRDVIGVVDFSLGSNLPRFHIVDLMAGRAQSFLVAHGRGSDPDHSGFVERFSNTPGSEATSNGTYVTANTYDGKYGLSMKVKGLDWSNSNAESRAIVIHNAWYAEDEMIAEHGKLGRSEGCFAFGRASHWQVMAQLGDGRMIYADKLA